MYADARARFKPWVGSITRQQSIPCLNRRFAVKRTYKPGQPAPASAQVQIIGPRGGLGPERTVIRGKPLPPTPKPGSSYRVVDPNRNGAGRSK